MEEKKYDLLYYIHKRLLSPTCHVRPQYRRRNYYCDKSNIYESYTKRIFIIILLLIVPGASGRMSFQPNSRRSSQTVRSCVAPAA